MLLFLFLLLLIRLNNCPCPSIISACPRPAPRTASAKSAVTMTGQSVEHCSMIHRERGILCNCLDNRRWTMSAIPSPTILTVSPATAAHPHRAVNGLALHVLHDHVSSGTFSCSAPSIVATCACASLRNCPRRDSQGTTESWMSLRTNDGTRPRRQTAAWASVVASSCSAFAGTRNGTDVELIRC